MAQQLLNLEQYYHRLIMDNLERVDLIVRDFWKLGSSVFVNKLSTLLLVYVVDLSAFPDIADVISDELVFPVNRLLTSVFV